MPKTLEILIFGDCFDNGDQPFNKGDLPENLKILKFGKMFNNGGKSIKKYDLPETITTLVFGEKTIRNNAKLSKNIKF